MAVVTVHRLLELIVAGDREAVVETAVDLARVEGLDPVIALLAGVQHEVGRRWQDTDWSVADEHAATALSDLALAAAALTIAPAEPTGGAVVVTCAEEEWHVLPARMFAEQLRAYGWEVVFLGASTPADHLAAYLRRHPVVAVGVSCSIPVNLPGARRSIVAAHEAGVPAMAGGAAFGTTPIRAVAAGADAWATSIEAAHGAACSWAGAVPPLARPADDRDQLALAAYRQDMVDAAMADLAMECPDVAGYSPSQLKRTREDLDYIVRFVEAAVLTADDTVVDEFVRWLVPLLSARGVPPRTVVAGIDVLRRHLPPQHQSAARLLGLASGLVDQLSR
ncbi:MAG TPA: cobalamin B12-binding domain-containing protein [Acidimicrobiales bacterium]|nr:cobalamin B12-binding domain-containing protein [Acidimicrobiales bacterium]